LRKGVIFLIQN